MPALSAKGVDKPSDIKGFSKPAAGFYHAAINSWDETCKEKDQVIVSFQILAGTTDGMTGREQREHMPFEDRGNSKMDRILKLVMACRVMKPGEELNRDLTDEMLGKQCIIEIVEANGKGENKDKKYSNVADYGYGVYDLDDPAVAHVPKNANALRLLSNPGSSQGTAAASGQSGQQSSAAANKWSDV